jgi:hypothetical protein
MPHPAIHEDITGIVSIRKAMVISAIKAIAIKELLFNHAKNIPSFTRIMVLLPA